MREMGKIVKNIYKTVVVVSVVLLHSVTVHAAENETQEVFSLEVAVETALRNNLNVQLKKEDVEVAAGGVEIAESRFAEELKAEVGAESNQYAPLIFGATTQEDRGRIGASLSKRLSYGTELELSVGNNRYDGDTDGLIYNPSYESSVDIGVSQPLLRGFGSDIQTGDIQAAKKNLEASVFQVDSLAADLAAEVKKGYWDLVYAWQNIEVQKLSVALAEQLLADTKEKIEAGRLAEVEIYQPESEVARREEDLISAERAIGFAEDQLKLLMNSDDWFITLLPSDLPTTEPVQLEQKQILAIALSNRPDLLAAERTIEAAKIQERLAEDDLLPELNLVGGFGVGGTDDSYGRSVSAITDDTDTRWRVGLNLTMPIDNSYAKGSLRQAKAQYKKAKSSTALLRLRIQQSVRTTVRDVGLAIKGMEATRKTSIATSKRLEAEQAKFDAGRSTTLDVLIAQEAYAQALSQEKRMAVVYVKLLAEIDRIQGLVTMSTAR